MISSKTRHWVYQAVISFGLFLCIQGDSITPDLQTSTEEVSSSYFKDVPYSSPESSIYLLSSSLDVIDVQKTILPSQILSELRATATPNLNFIPSSATTFSTTPSDILSSSGDTPSPTVPETHTVSHTTTSISDTFSNLSSETSRQIFSLSSSSSTLRKNGISMFLPESSDRTRFVSPDFGKTSTTTTTEEYTTEDANFHTPLMSLLAASSTSHDLIPPTSVYPSGYPHHTLPTTTDHNESVDDPPDDHKKLLMLVLRAEDCTRLSKADFEKMLGKLMAKFGFGDVVPEVSNAKCYSHLNINLTIGHSSPTLRFLPNVRYNNITVDVLNRTFRIVKLEKIDLRFEKSSHNSTHVITKVANHESVAYIAVGVSFGLVLVLCITVCCIKCCCLRKSQKRFLPGSHCTHVRLRPEDYTLTPIPRPTSLYVDYYRGSVTADIYSTTSGGSIASTTPTVDQGVVQPFDTSIVPLEDSAPLDTTSRDPSVESVPTPHSTMKTFNLHSFGAKGLRMASTDSKEQLHPKQNVRKTEVNPAGVANPTFQRY